MAAEDFLNAIMERTGGAGFVTNPFFQSSNKYNRPTLEKLSADVKAKMDIASKTDRPAKRERKTRTENLSLTPEEQAYKDYDDSRQKLTAFLGEMLNAPKGVSSEKAALTEIVDAVSRGRREAGYGTQQPIPTVASTSAPEPAKPAATPAAEPAPKATQATPPTQAAPAPERAEMIPSYGRDEAAIAEMEVAQNESPSYGRDEAAIAEMEAAQNKQPTVSEDRMAQLYRKTTGAVYNPEVSKAAREKMAQLKSFVSSNPDMLSKSDTKIALDFYRTLK
jgi:hypothetical protein